MKPELIELTEYQAAELWLEDDDRDHILRLVRGAREDERRVFQSITPTSESHVYRVTPGHFVGRLGLPSGRSIDIQSRFTFDDTLELIRNSLASPLRADELSVPTAHKPFLLDVLARAFHREVDHLISFGLAKGYRRHQFDRPPYPGVPDINLHLSRFAARPDKLITSARRITVDVAVNRALAWALDILGRVPLDAEVARNLNRAQAAFARTARRPVSASDIRNIGLDRLTNRYAASLHLAELIVSGQSLGPTGDDYGGSSILFDMSKVWEMYVGRWVESTAEAGQEVLEGYGFDITRDGSVRGYADVSVWEGDQIVALYDAKYKWLGDRPSTSDIYQMVTYCTRLGLNEVTLVYPAPARSTSLHVDDITIYTLGLEVTTPALQQAAS